MVRVRRKRFLVVLILMSFFVIMTQAFEITNRPVVIDWSYDSWGDELFVTVTDSIITANSATDYDVTIELSNSDTGPQTRSIRVELLYASGARVERTGETDSAPDDNNMWLVAEQLAIEIPAGGSIWTGIHSFVDDKVSDVVTGGGYFMIYTDEQSGVWTNGNYVNADKIHLDIDAPDYDPSVFQTIRPTVATDLIGSWSGVTPGEAAWDGDTGTATSNADGTVSDTISFTTFEPVATLPINRVDVNLLMQVIGFDTPAPQKGDLLNIAVYVVDEELVVNQYNANIDATITFADVPAPVDGWTPTTIGLIQVKILAGTLVGKNLDVFNTYDIFEVWVEINP